MTATIPSIEEYEHARYVLDHPQDFDADDVAGAQQWIAEFETAVRDAVATQFRDPRRVQYPPASVPQTVMPAWCDMNRWLQDVLFDAAMVGARTAQGGAR